MSNLKVVNAVGSGSLGIELNLERLSEDIRGSIASYDPEKYPGMYLRFEETSPLITVYRTGKYIITGSESDEEARSFRKRFLQLLSDMGVIEEPTDEWFKMQNYVCTAELGEAQNLNTLAIGLGLEQTEYEPEQFPGLVYRSPSLNSVILIFGTGKVVVTGCRSVDEAESAFDFLKKELSSLDLV